MKYKEFTIVGEEHSYALVAVDEEGNYLNVIEDSFEPEMTYAISRDEACDEIIQDGFSSVDEAKQHIDMVLA